MNTAIEGHCPCQHCRKIPVAAKIRDVARVDFVWRNTAEARIANAGSNSSMAALTAALLLRRGGPAASAESVPINYEIIIMSVRW
jgi:deoxycytidylate deaminase